METLKSSEMPQMPETEEGLKLDKIFPKLFFALRRFVHFRANIHNVMVSLTIILSYFVDLFEAISYVHLQGFKDTGKTTVLIITGLSGYNPLNATGATDAVICRMIHQKKGILMLDDAEILAIPPRPRSLLVQALKSGYKKAGGSVWVCDRSDPYKWIEYKVYCLKLTANTEGIYDTALRSRYIIIPMSQPNPDQQPEIFYPSSDDGKLFSNIGKDLLRLSEDKNLRNSIRNHYVNLRRDERLRGIRGRFFEILSPYFALAKALEESYGRECLFQRVLDFAKDYIDERNRDRFHTDPDTMAIYLVWKYVKELSGKEGFAENKYFFAQKLGDYVKTNLIEYFGKLDFEFTLKRLGKILDTQGFLIWPEKGKVMRVRQEEDIAKASDPAWHYHIDVDALKKFAEKSFKEYEDPDVDKPANREGL